MSERNKYGLGRYIPREIRREIRSRCGFGCVICGLALYDYEHFDPDFKDAREHNPKGMTLLCPRCNQKRARGTLSAESVALANQNPKCKQRGFASELFDFGPEPINVQFAGVSFYDCPVPLRVRGVDILSFRPPAAPGSPVLLSGLLSDVTGATTLKIVDNVWHAGDKNWDVEVKGPCVTIRRGERDIALQFRVSPPHSIAIERLEMEIEGLFLRGNKHELSVSTDRKSWGNFIACDIRECPVGLCLG